MGNYFDRIISGAWSDNNYCSTHFNLTFLKMKQDKIKSYLPSVFQRTTHSGNPLEAFLGIMEMLHTPSENVLSNVDRFFDPRRTPDEFVPFLARWVNLDRVFTPNATIETASPLMPKMGHLRELVSDAVYLSKWRGTKKGLLLFLQTATGEKDFEIEERVRVDDGQPQPFHLKIRAPQTTEEQAELIKRIIDSEKPVHLTYEFEFF